MDNNNFEPDYKVLKSERKGIKQSLINFGFGLLGGAVVILAFMGIQYANSNSKTNNTASTVSEIVVNDSSSKDLVNVVDYSDTSVQVAKTAQPSVVGITVEYSVSSIFGGTGKGEATGSGVILTTDGYILTNNHVISSQSSNSYYDISEATKVTVTLYNQETEYEAKIIGTDEYTDLAVIKIEAENLTAATLGSSSNLQVGEFVMAIGNPLGLNSSVSCGVVSAVNRTVTDSSSGNSYETIQTDAAINSGNSGGALVNSKGEVIGINSMKLSGTGIEGIGFAIPIDSAMDTINQLIQNGKVTRPYIGIEGSDIESETAQRYNLPTGIYVEKIVENGPAAKAGIQKGDIITKIEGTAVTTMTELNKIKNTYKVGDTVTLTIYRNNAEQEIKVTLQKSEQNN